MFFKVIIILSYAAICVTADDTDLAQTNEYTIRTPYDLVAKCTPAVLATRLVDFNIDDLSNAGFFDYVYYVPGPHLLQCGYARFYGDKTTSYKRQAAVTTTDGVITDKTYDLSSVDRGVIQEIITDEAAKGENAMYEFQLVINKFNKELGVYYLTRCSKYGTSFADNRVIGISNCNKNSSEAVALADKWALEDSQVGYKGGYLKKLDRCPNIPQP